MMAEVAKVLYRAGFTRTTQFVVRMAHVHKHVCHRVIDIFLHQYAIASK